MQSLAAGEPLGKRINAWLADELRPAAIAQSLVSAVLVYMVIVIATISFASLIFSGSLVSQLSSALGYVLVGGAILQVIVAVFSSYSGSMACEQDTSGAILAVASASILALLPAQASHGEQFATVVMMIVCSTVITGLFFVLLGAFNLGRLVRFLPYPVMGGFLAGTGWLLVTGGIGVMAHSAISPELLQPATLLRWLPGVVVGIVLLIVVSRSSNPLALPAIFALGIVLFYIVIALTHTSVDQLSADGWLLGPFPSGNLWQFPLNGNIVSQVNWPVLLDQLPNLASLLIVSVIALLLNASGLELIIKKDINLNHELVTAGLGNIAAGFAGSLVGYHTISLSALNHTTAGGRRLPGFFVAALLGLTAIFGASVLTYVPLMSLGALLIYVGLDLVVEWVYRAWFKFSRTDFLIIVLILGTIAARGFLEGIAVGLVMTVIMFIISYSRISLVRTAMTGADMHSLVSRPQPQQRILATHAHQIYILRLQGYIFFGTANNLFEQLRRRLQVVEQESVKRLDTDSVRYIILDFEQITGLDSTGILSFKKMLQLAHDKHCTLIFTGLKDTVRDQFAAGGLPRQPGILELFSDLDHGLEWCENRIIATAQPSSQSIDLRQELQAMLSTWNDAQELHSPMHGHGSAEDDQPPAPDDEPETMLSRFKHLRQLIKHMQRREVQAGEYLMRQGEESDALYLIESAQVTAQRESPGQAPMRLETMRGGRIVGELGFYLETRRTASVVVDEPGTVYALTREDLRRMEQTDPATAHIFNSVIIHLLGERVVKLTEQMAGYSVR